MGFFRKRSRRGSYDLFSAYNYFVPDISELAWVMVLFLAGMFLGVIVAAVLAFATSQEFAATYGMVIVYPVQFIPAMLYASAKSRMNEGFEKGYALDNNNFGGRSGFSMALIVSAMAVAAAFVFEPVSILLPDMSEEMKAALEVLLNGPVWIVLISVSVFAPFFEEWLCRGIILRGLLKKVKPTWAIVISAAIFGLIHGNLWQAIPAFLIGVILGYVYYKTGSLKLTMLMHCVNNTLSVIVSRIPAFKDVEFFADVMSPWAYVTVIIAFAVVLASGLIIIRSIPLKDSSSEGDLGACKLIKTL
ncbi:MAG: CPBP family intramembrane metalloprotease [Bacteroidales bacterium]|nr:CPBP family intramembrane metalloprotease [Bacteroidales bacterium]MBR5861801.1 CPBP family intramembrane metalloprotease [Bacteroidales bacterium]